MVETSKKQHWYQRINGLIVGLGVLFPISYIVFSQIVPQYSNADLVAVKPVAAIVATTALTFAIIGYPLLHGKQPRIGISIGFLLIYAAVALQILAAGGAVSPYLVIWGILVITAGFIGWEQILVAVITTNLYWAMVALDYIDVEVSAARMPLYIIATQLPLIVAFLIWMYTRNIRHEDSVSNLSTNLSTEQHKSDFVLQAMTDAVLILNNKGVIEYLNPAAEILTGWSAAEATDLNYRTILKFTDGVKSSEETDPIKGIFTTGRNFSTSNLMLSSKNNAGINVGLSVATLADNSTQNGITIILRDISKQIADDKRKTDFISTASHEMRTPIAQIKGYLELLANPSVVQIDEKAMHYVEKSLGATKHLGDLFSDLLAASKNENGRFDLNLGPVNLNQLLQSVVENNMQIAHDAGLTLSLDIIQSDKTQPDIYTFAETAKLVETFDNLISNAIKYTPKGSVIVRMAANDHVAQIDFVDTGVGIAKDHFKELFKKFYRVDSSETREVGGTGLGLYIAKQIIDLHEGKIWVDSEVGKGSVFHVQLKRLPAASVQQILDRPKAQTTSKKT